jgi:putative tryptophan/tyrosine transport system substrate-binding protein
MRASIVRFALGALLVALSVPAAAQQPEKVYRIGILAGSAQALGWQPRNAALQQGLRELGYVEGQNVILEYRYAAGNVARFPELAAELVRLNVDLIVASGQPAVQAAKRSTPTIPIVMTVPTDPVETGLVESLARPGGNITGFTSLTIETAGKRLELF